jgi:cytochrome b involved in lipid metabolism
MKWLTAAVLIILVGTVTVFVVGGLVDREDSAVPSNRPRTTTSTTLIPSTVTKPGETTTPTSSSPITTSAPTTPEPSFTAAEVAQHSSSTSCWLLIDARVYDVTRYLRNHPGGSRTILPWCGRESTTAFATEDGRGEHSDEAYALLDEYFIGELRA